MQILSNLKQVANELIHLLDVDNHPLTKAECQGTLRFTIKLKHRNSFSQHSFGQLNLVSVLPGMITSKIHFLKIVVVHGTPQNAVTRYIIKY
jgi:hypothetical protein